MTNKPEFNLSRFDVAADVAHELYPIDPPSPKEDPENYRKLKDAIFAGEEAVVEAEAIVIQHDGEPLEGEE